MVNRSSPVQIGTGADWYLVSSNSFIGGAIKTNGTLWLWGGNGYGQLGDNTRVYKSSPIQIGALTTWSQISILASQGNMAAARKSDYTLWAWGRGNYGGVLGQNNTINRSSPTQIGSNTNWGYLSRGNNYRTCAITFD
jgi:alpha-tubulin suppressor-like RCC1 family protein